MMWPEAAYRDDVLVRQFFGRENFLLNAPDAIHHVLVDNHANYRRTPASIRILRPIAGDPSLRLVRICKEDEGVAICTGLASSPWNTVRSGSCRVTTADSARPSMTGSSLPAMRRFRGK